MCTEKTVNVTDLNDLSSLSIESGIVLPKKLGHRYTYEATLGLIECLKLFTCTLGISLVVLNRTTLVCIYMCLCFRLPSSSMFASAVSGSTLLHTSWLHPGGTQSIL